MNNEKNIRKIKRLLIFFSVSLIVSGLTAMPVKWEMEVLNGMRFYLPTEIGGWLTIVKEGIDHASENYPYLLYGYDWLAFAHIIIAIFFYGSIKDPVKNIWIIEAGMIACVLIIPLAFICGVARGIPLGWTMVDSSFGIIGIIPLYYARKFTLQLSEKNIPETKK